MKPRPRHLRGLGRRAGFTIFELMITLTIFVVILGAVLGNMQRDADALSSMARRTHSELTADQMLRRIAASLEFAQAVRPQAFLIGDLGSGTTSGFTLNDNVGFPDEGIALLAPGTANEELIRYEELDAGTNEVLSLERGFACTDGASHVDGQIVRSARVAEVLEDQLAPPASAFEGISQEIAGPVFFRGYGYGFVYQVPTDPGGNMNYFTETGEVRFGATVDGTPTLDGRSTIYFEPAAQITEAARNADINGDGDLADTFDLGRIRMRSWDSSDPSSDTTDFALCEPMILQENCNWGGDLDNDGFEDPIFLWDSRTGRVRIRLFLLVSRANEIPEVRSVESVIFLRNGVED